MPKHLPTITQMHLGRRLPEEQRVPNRRERSELVAFLEKVETVPDGCWIWRGRIAPNGYAQYRSRDRAVFHAHRMSYRLFVGPLDPELQIDHLCRNRACVNPDHLEQVTGTTNLRRAMPWTACDRLHPKLATRIGERGDGREYCKECQRVREAERRARFAEQEAARTTKRPAPR